MSLIFYTQPLLIAGHAHSQARRLEAALGHDEDKRVELVSLAIYDECDYAEIALTRDEAETLASALAGAISAMSETNLTVIDGGAS